MKIKILIAALVMLGFSSCAYKTCPTYAKQDKQQVEEKATIEKARG